MAVALALIASASMASSPPMAAPPSARGAGSSAKGPFVWVAAEDDSKLVKVDLGGRRVVRRVSVPGRPHNITVSSGETVAATLWGDGVLSLVRKKKVRNIRLDGAPHDVKVGRGRIVVANQGGARVDIFTPWGYRHRTVALKANPHDLALTPGGDTAWVTLEGDDDMAVVDLADRRVRRYVSTGRSPHDLLFSPSGRLWVTDWRGAFHVYSRRGKHLKTRSLGDEAHHLAFTPDGKHVWITDHGAHRVFVVSTRTYRVVDRIRVRGAPHHVAMTPTGDRAVVADHERGLLIVYRASTRKRVAKISVGAGPHGVWPVSN